MNQVEEYKLAMRRLNARYEQLEALLWQAQLEQYPDSVRVSVSDALRWQDVDETMRNALANSQAWWDRENLFCEDDDRGEHVALRRAHADRAMARYQLQTSRCLANCLQYPVGVFYTCCEGKYRGFRYGIEWSEYLSGFTL